MPDPKAGRPHCGATKKVTGGGFVPADGLRPWKPREMNAMLVAVLVGPGRPLWAPSEVSAQTRRFHTSGPVQAPVELQRKALAVGLDVRGRLPLLPRRHLHRVTPIAHARTRKAQ